MQHTMLSIMDFHQKPRQMLCPDSNWQHALHMCALVYPGCHAVMGSQI